MNHETPPGILIHAKWVPNLRGRRLRIMTGCVLLFAAIIAVAQIMGTDGLNTNLRLRHMPPSLAHPFGTDWLGRDMMTRTILGLYEGLKLGVLAAACSGCISLILGSVAGLRGGRVDHLICGLINVVMSTPHLVLLILISFVLGGGTRGVVIAVALSHWPQLARIIRAEVMQLKNAPYVHLSARLGRSGTWIIRRHLLPHLLPQCMIGFMLLAPHAILHAAGLTFLGFGVSPHAPNIGMLLAESMRHISTGYWWLAVIPGASLVVMVLTFDTLAATARTLLNPKTRQE
jgi:peptide/nickel transport system permease protein